MRRGTSAASARGSSSGAAGAPGASRSTGPPAAACALTAAFDARHTRRTGLRTAPTVGGIRLQVETGRATGGFPGRTLAGALACGAEGCSGASVAAGTTVGIVGVHVHAESAAGLAPGGALQHTRTREALLLRTTLAPAHAAVPFISGKIGARRPADDASRVALAHTLA